LQDVRLRRSPLFFVGDKAKLLSQLVPSIPRSIDTYVEPFLGGGSLSLNVSAKKFILSDISAPLVTIHKRLRELSLAGDLVGTVCRRIQGYGLTCSHLGIAAPRRLLIKYPKTYFAEANRKAYLELRSKVNSSQDPDPLDLYILVVYGFNRMLRFNRHGKFNVPVGNVDFNAKTAAALEEFQEFHTSNDKVRLIAQDFRDCFPRLRLGRSDFVYLDPPYLITEAEYNARWTSADDLVLCELFESLNATGVRVAMSNVLQYRDKHNVSLETWARQFSIVEIRSNYISRFDNRQKRIREVLITNF
jgi:DNA adenine methylase